MPGYLLDSSVIIDALNRKRRRVALLEDLLLQGNSLGCCAVNVAEVYSGMRAAESEMTDELLRSLDYYEITWEVARRAGEIRCQQARKGRTLHLADTIIASVALTYGLALITDNIKDFKIPGVNLFPL